MVHVSLQTLLGLATVLSSVHAAATISKRADNSLFNPETEKPDAQDVIDYFKDMGDEGDTFDQSFMTSVYAIVLQEPERIEKLFVSKEERGYEMSIYDPVNRGREAITRNFDMMKNWKGEDETDAFKDKWWVAALHGWLKEVWAGYYEPISVLETGDEVTEEGGATPRYQEWTLVPTELIPTEKGEEYGSIFESWIRSKITPFRIGNADLKAAHWVMSVLTKRSIAIKYYGVEDQDVLFGRNVRLPAEEMGKVVKQSPVVWLGSTVPNGGSGWVKEWEAVAPRMALQCPNWANDDWEDQNYVADIRNQVVKSVDSDSNLQLVDPSNGGEEERLDGNVYRDFWQDNGQFLGEILPPAVHVLFLENLDEEWGSDWFDREAPSWESFDFGEIPVGCPL